jgi:glycosyltransferase involved in cell wall biosynthesis
MKIVHVAPSYPPALGGLEKVAQILATIQGRKHKDVMVVTSDFGGGNQGNTDEVTVKRFASFRFANTNIFPALISELWKLGRGDVVHIHFASAYIPEVVWILSKVRGFKYVMHMHIDFGPSGRAGFLLKLYKPFVLKWALRAASFVAVFTEDQQLAMHQRYGIDASRIKIIPNGVGEQFYYDKPRAPHQKFRLLFVGRLEAQKNLQLLLRALDSVSEQFDTTIVGEGSQLDELQATVASLKLANVTFAGRADGEDLLHLYREADAFVLPSEREGMPLVLLEAMAMGLPTVATKVTGSRDVVRHGETGHLTKPDDAQSLRKALVDLKSHPKQYKSFSQYSRTLANDYSWDKVSARFEELYKEAANG